MMRTRSLLIFAPLVTLALACGSLGDVSHREPLAVLDGELTQTSTVVSPATPSSTLRVAVVWASVDGTSSYKTAQDIVATPVFPSKFRLELTDPPPAEAMSSTPGPARKPVSPTVDNGAGTRSVAGLHPSGAPAESSPS